MGAIQANLPKEIADYLNKMGARIPHVKPGKATIEYLTKIQASTRFWGIFLLMFVISFNIFITYPNQQLHFSSIIFINFFFAYFGLWFFWVEFCRGAIIEHFGHYVNNSWSLSTSYQWGIFYRIYISINYCKFIALPCYTFVLFMSLNDFLLCCV